jgi:hypothetical protein
MILEEEIDRINELSLQEILVMPGIWKLIWGRIMIRFIL